MLCFQALLFLVGLLVVVFAKNMLAYNARVNERFLPAFLIDVCYRSSLSLWTTRGVGILVMILAVVLGIVFSLNSTR
jgi:hypothetical protein